MKASSGLLNFRRKPRRERCYGEKNAGRLAQRNGYRERDYDTWAGTVDLRIPKLRTGSYFTSFL